MVVCGLCQNPLAQTFDWADWKAAFVDALPAKHSPSGIAEAFRY